MAYDEDKVDRVLLAVRDIASKHAHIREIEDHYAGYFDELGLTVQLENTTKPDQWHSAAIELLLYLNKVLPKDNDAFPWILSFYLELQQVGLFFPGDSLSNNCADVIVNPSNR